MYRAALLFIISILGGLVWANYSLGDQSFYKVLITGHYIVEVVMAVVIAGLLPRRDWTRTFAYFIVVITTLTLLTFVFALITTEYIAQKTHTEIGNEQF